jgi:hypothetical protein
MKSISLLKAIPIRSYRKGKEPRSIASCNNVNDDLDVIDKNASEIISDLITL